MPTDYRVILLFDKALIIANKLSKTIRLPEVSLPITGLPPPLPVTVAASSCQVAMMRITDIQDMTG